MTETATLGIVLGAVLGFLGGAIVVGVVALYFRRKTKSYDTDRPTRRSVEYSFASPPQNLVPSHTRPVPIQPNIYRLKKDEDGEEEADVEDGEERVRVTQPYDLREVQMDVIEEENGKTFAEITDLTPSESDSPATAKRKKLTRGVSLPTNIVSSDLIHYNQDILMKEPQQCVLETSMFYDTASKELHITVIQVLGIPSPDESFLRPPNCSVKMRILPEMLTWQWTRKVSRTVSPVFNETFIVPGFVHNKLRECTVHFVVLDFDHVQDNVYVIGEVFMPLSELRANRLEKISKRVNPLSI